MLAACCTKIGFVQSKVSELSVLIFRFQDELYLAQEEEKLLAVSQFDLGMKPKFKNSDRTKSISMPNIHTVKPVESAIRVAFDSPKAPTKKKTDGQIKIMNVTTVSNRLQKQTFQKRVCKINLILSDSLFNLFSSN